MSGRLAIVAEAPVAGIAGRDGPLAGGGEARTFAPGDADGLAAWAPDAVVRLVAGGAGAGPPPERGPAERVEVLWFEAPPAAAPAGLAIAPGWASEVRHPRADAPGIRHPSGGESGLRAPGGGEFRTGAPGGGESGPRAPGGGESGSGAAGGGEFRTGAGGGGESGGPAGARGELPTALWRRAPWPAREDLLDLPPGDGVLVAGGAPARRRALVAALGGRGIAADARDLPDRDAQAGAAVVLIAGDPGAPLPGAAPAVLAAGRVLVAPRAAPAFGLQAGIDHLAYDDDDGAAQWVEAALAAGSGTAQLVALGRAAARAHAAGAVYGRLLADLARGR